MMKSYSRYTRKSEIIVEFNKSHLQNDHANEKPATKIACQVYAMGNYQMGCMGTVLNYITSTSLRARKVCCDKCGNRVLSHNRTTRRKKLPTVLKNLQNRGCSWSRNIPLPVH